MAVFVWGCVCGFCCVDLLVVFKETPLHLLVGENALFCSEECGVVQAYCGSQLTKNNASKMPMNYFYSFYMK